MTETIRVLYDYASAIRIPGFLTGPEYESYCLVSDRQEQKLRALLPPEGQQLLSDYLEETHQKGAMELEAAFQSGLSLGMELSHA